MSYTDTSLLPTPLSSMQANFFLVVMAVTCLLFSIIVYGIYRAMRQGRTSGQLRAVWWLILLLTVGLTCLCSCLPAILGQDMVLAGAYARMVTVYHLNPYVSPLSTITHDSLVQLAVSGNPGTAHTGPIWLDISLLLVLLAGDNFSALVFNFHLLGGVIHVLNVLLLWLLLAKKRPALRLICLLLYAWNPVVLLLTVCSVHNEALVTLFLLGSLLCMRNQLYIPGWFCILLACLTNQLCLLLLPLFACLLYREIRVLPAVQRWLYYLLLCCCLPGVLICAYLPYWQDWGLAGWLESLRTTFLSHSAARSLDAVLLHSPLLHVAGLAWVIMPSHWNLLMLVGITGLVVLVGCWMVDRVETLTLFWCWMMLLLLLLSSTFSPWSVLMPLALSLCLIHRRTLILTFLLTGSAVLISYFMLVPDAWPGYPLVCLCLPVLVWGWLLFFSALWNISGAAKPYSLVKQGKGSSRYGFSRPPLFSRPPGTRKKLA